MDDKLIRSALLKQFISDIGKDRIKNYRGDPKDEELKEMDPADLEGTGLEVKKIEIKPGGEPKVTDVDDDEIPEDILKMIQERRQQRREKADQD